MWGTGAQGIRPLNSHIIQSIQTLWSVQPAHRVETSQASPCSPYLGILYSLTWRLVLLSPSSFRIIYSTKPNLLKAGPPIPEFLPIPPYSRLGLDNRESGEWGTQALVNGIPRCYLNAWSSCGAIFPCTHASADLWPHQWVSWTPCRPQPLVANCLFTCTSGNQQVPSGCPPVGTLIPDAAHLPIVCSASAWMATLDAGFHLSLLPGPLAWHLFSLPRTDSLLSCFPLPTCSGFHPQQSCCLWVLETWYLYTQAIQTLSKAGWISAGQALCRQRLNLSCCPNLGS